jgi:hypothetical protein
MVALAARAELAARADPAATAGRTPAKILRTAGPVAMGLMAAAAETVDLEATAEPSRSNTRQVYQHLDMPAIMAAAKVAPEAQAAEAGFRGWVDCAEVH